MTQMRHFGYYLRFTRGESLRIVPIVTWSLVAGGCLRTAFFSKKENSQETFRRTFYPVCSEMNNASIVHLVRIH